MAFVKFNRGLFPNGNTAKGLNYGQIEPNQVWFDRAGMVEAQCKLDTDCFSDAQEAPLAVYAAGTQKIVAQVGAFLQVNKQTYTATIPTEAGLDAGFPVGINYATERIYDDTAKQRRKFFLTTEDWLPRIGYVERGMRITTNTVQWDNAGSTTAVDGKTVTFNTADSKVFYDSVKDFIAAGGVLYAAVLDGSDGELVIVGDTIPTGAGSKPIILAQVVAAYSNADRTCSFMFQILDGGTK